MSLTPFKIDIPQAQLDDLYRRLRSTRWPVLPDGIHWNRGTQPEYLQSLIHYWLNDYDWKKQEAQLNQLPHYLCDLQGTKIHFIYQKGQGKSSVPLILTHGWPDSFYRYHKILPMLTNPEQFGGTKDDAFDVIIPSLPGFGFSGPLNHRGINNARIADMWHTLMTDILGYQHYMAGGGDIGSGVSRHLADKYPNNLTGLHLSDIGIIRELLSYGEQNRTEEELTYKQTVSDWLKQEAGYMSVQATKPATLAIGLNDSPAGLASWIIEKFQSWSDCNGDLDSRFNKDELLTNIMLYWLTGTIGSSVNLYYENMKNLSVTKRSETPCAIARFGADILLPPRSWAEKYYNIKQWTDIPNGGHFTTLEEPVSFVKDIRRFSRTLRS